jgi:hypothetical protein
LLFPMAPSLFPKSGASNIPSAIHCRSFDSLFDSLSCKNSHLFLELLSSLTSGSLPYNAPWRAPRIELGYACDGTLRIVRLSR